MWLICPSEKGRAYVASFVPGLCTAVIGNGASAERFNLDGITDADRDRARAALGIEPSDRVILYVGRLAQEKRVLALLEALRPLLYADDGCQAASSWVRGRRGRRWRWQCMKQAWSRRCLFTGRIDWERMAELYAIAHAFATASLSEVHPMTLIEAVMCGLPIVARRDVSFVDLVQDGYNGFLVDSDRGDRRQAGEILQDETKQRAFAHNALTLSGQFTIETHVDRLEALYRQVTTSARKELFQ